MHVLYRRYKNFRPFTNDEAWAIVRLAAIAEAVGWLLLILGILIGRYLTPGNTIAVQLAGRTHGTLFILYIVAVIVCVPSLEWSFFRLLLAGGASAPPFGSLVFEIVIAYERQLLTFRRVRAGVIYRVYSQERLHTSDAAKDVADAVGDN